MGQALGRRDPDPQAGERSRTGADDDGRRRGRCETELLEQRGDGRQERLAVAVAGRPVGRLDQLAGPRADRDDHPGRGAVDGQDDGSRRVGCGGGHGTTAR